MAKGQPLHRRVHHALDGLCRAVRGERSLRTHLLATGAVLAALVALRPAPLWWAAAALACALVIAAELLNTALETLADRLHPEHDPAIGAAKDVAAAAVLVASLAALVVALAFVVDHWR